MSLFLFSNGELSAQELNAKVTVNHNQIQGTDASVFENLQQTLEQFINTRQWTHYQFQRNERINCNFNITVSKYDPGSNLFTCSALIQANRPVYNAAYSSTLYNNQDGDFNFTFAQFDQIEFNEENIEVFAQKVLEDINPRDSWRASKAFRCHIGVVMARKACEKAVKQAGGKVDDRAEL